LRIEGGDDNVGMCIDNLNPHYYLYPFFLISSLIYILVSGEKSL